MLRITFKAVGQGDSILLEWQDEEGQNHIGVIDCNLVNSGRNPVLEHIKRQNYSKIDFLILSHPHSDHFSGFSSLLDYCEKEAIKVEVFFHSCHLVPDYLKAACTSITSQREAGMLFQKIMRLFKEGKLDKRILDQSGYPFLELPNRLKIKCLSPSERERDDYVSTKKYFYNEEEKDNNPKANFLSSLLKIYQEGEEWYILLTADSEASTFQRLDKKNGDEFTGELLLAQCPHHGAKLNCKRPFWMKKRKSKACFAVFSVGENSYGHPDQWTKDTFIDNDYSLRYTSDLSKLNRSKTADNNRMQLSPFSVPILPEKDLLFELDNGAIREVV